MDYFKSNFYLNLFLTSLVLILVPLKLLAAMRSRKNKPNLPPGPWKLPVIGNLHQLLARPLLHRHLRDLAANYGDLMHLQLGELSYIIVSSAEIASKMMRTHDIKFSQRPSFSISQFLTSKSLTFAPYGEYWRQLIKICTQELLSPARVRSFRSLREEEVSSLVELLRSAAPGTPVNLSEKIFAMTYAITARAAFGKKCKEQDIFAASLGNFIKLAARFGVAELFPSQKWLLWLPGLGPSGLQKHFKIMDGVLQEIIKNCVADRCEESTKGNSLLDVLLDVQEKGGFGVSLEPKNIRSVIQDIFGGGSETSSTTIEWAMFELLRNPTVMEKAQAEARQVFRGEKEIDVPHLHELTYLDFVIKETLRLHPPGTLIPREAIESCTIDGYDIPVKAIILVNAWAIGRDPRYWSDPEKFHPERFIDGKIDFKGVNFEFIPFGGGRRMCPGISFAMPNIKLPLAHLLFHFDWKLPINGRITPKNGEAIETFGASVRLKDELYLIPVPYSATTSTSTS